MEHNRENCIITDSLAQQLARKNRGKNLFQVGLNLFSVIPAKMEEKKKIWKTWEFQSRREAWSWLPNCSCWAELQHCQFFGFLPNGHKKEFISKPIANTSHILNIWSAIKLWLLKNWQVIHGLSQQTWCHWKHSRLTTPTMLPAQFLWCQELH